jgi:hypothetical protein
MMHAFARLLRPCHESHNHHFTSCNTVWTQPDRPGAASLARPLAREYSGGACRGPRAGRARDLVSSRVPCVLLTAHGAAPASVCASSAPSLASPIYPPGFVPPPRGSGAARRGAARGSFGEAVAALNPGLRFDVCEVSRESWVVKLATPALSSISRLFSFKRLFFFFTYFPLLVGY